MKCLIVDDEPLATDILESFVNNVPFLKLVGKCNSAIDALNVIKNEQVDLLFLDIQMPKLSGIDMVKTLNQAPLIIFTTAYSNYALEGFELNAIDYLVKPIPFDRFLKAVNKAYELFDLKRYKENGAPTTNNDKISGNYIMVKADYSMVRIDLDKILYIEGLKDYLKIFILGSKPVLTLNSLKKFEEKLPTDAFMRVHRSYIVPFDKIEAIQRHRIIINKEHIPIGDNYKEEFYRRINDKTLQ